MHYLGLEGRAALVTGGSSGIGRAISEELGRAGVAVGVNYHSGRENADEVVQGIEAEGGRAIALGADVSDQDACRAMFKAFVERFGRLDILVANSGIQRDAAFTELTLSDWQRVLDVNLTGAFLCAQEAVRQFRDQPPDNRTAYTLSPSVYLFFQGCELAQLYIFDVYKVIAEVS